MTHDLPNLVVEHGVPTPPGNRVLLHPTQSPQKLAKMLDKAARHVGDSQKLAKISKGKTTAKAKGKSKGTARVTKATGKAIVGSRYNGGSKK